MEHYIKNLLNHLKKGGVIPNDGYYIEAGANDGITQSYTYPLEKLGWNGVLIEPSKNAIEKCKENRSGFNVFINGALVGSERIRNVRGDFDGDFTSSVNGERSNKEFSTVVRAYTLDQILSRVHPNKIDLVSIDVEGYERHVFEGFNLQRWKPTYIVCEVCAETKNFIFEHMANNNYSLVAKLTEWNEKEYPKWDGVGNDYLFKLKI